MEYHGQLGTGIGWRPEIASAVERMPGVDWVEAVAENLCPGHLPDSLVRLRERGVTVVPHGVGLGLGGADRPDPERLAALAERALALESPLVTEHIAFVRAGGPQIAAPSLEAGHLLPVPRTRDALDVLCENVRIAQDALPVPLAVENIAALFPWPDEELTEGQFLRELVERTGVRLLIDVANLHTNHVNMGQDPATALSQLPVEAIAYVHVAGGFERDGVWHDSHAHPVPEPVLGILADLCSRTRPPGVLLERDENFPDPAELEDELDAIRATVRSGAGSGQSVLVSTPAREAATAPAEHVAEDEVLIVTSAAAGPAEDMVMVVTAAPPATAPRTATEQAAESGPLVEGANFADGSGAGARSEAGYAAGGAAGPEAAAVDWPAPYADDPRDGSLGDGALFVVGGPGSSEGPSDSGARDRLGYGQYALLAALVDAGPVPEGFDPARLGVQSRALAAKRADVVAKVAPELPEILGDGYRAHFLDYARTRPLTGGYRKDALDFAEFLLTAARPAGGSTRRRLSTWWLERSGPEPLPSGAVRRLARAARSVLLRR
ncbi:DUF692 domain-containing protein [Streptomyces tsukubensis]|uniref:Endonuclease n=1 Tax=Streptomyces tsukubensis TaxID=83656 RepID=A0A1V4AAS4_9ACTN|nr:DUF692 domain-containing protein [Streptomyces tsukubensis]OON80598.1 endonuclease [Streptomyces tsukubensis]QFR96251.1 DUF692 family protein [Streptomyces tsukubensis]